MKTPILLGGFRQKYVTTGIKEKRPGLMFNNTHQVDVKPDVRGSEIGAIMTTTIGNRELDRSS